MIFNFKLNFFLLSLPILSKNSLLDSPDFVQLIFKDPTTLLMEDLINFHNNIMFFLVGITLFVIWLLGRCLNFYNIDPNKEDINNFTPATSVEIVWTVVPAIILMVIVVPSFALLYLKGNMINFHNHIMFFLVGVGIFILWLLNYYLSVYNIDLNKKDLNNFTHATSVEVVWTIVPTIILMIIAVPSFALLYSIDEMLDPAITLKVVDHQWCWSYDYYDYNPLKEQNSEINFDSYLIADDNLGKRLLEIDNRRVVLPVNTHIGVSLTANGILHDWASPSLKIKVGVCPGRLNQTSFCIKKTGFFYGQCTELDGTNHGFMPICIKAVELVDYENWLEHKLDKKKPDLPFDDKIILSPEEAGGGIAYHYKWIFLGFFLGNLIGMCPGGFGHLFF